MRADDCRVWGDSISSVERLSGAGSWNVGVGVVAESDDCEWPPVCESIWSLRRKDV